MDELGVRAAPAAPDGGAGLARWGRRWWALVLGLALGAAAGLAFTATQPVRWTSTASVLVLPTGTGDGTDASGARSDVSTATEAALVSSLQVADAARAVLKTATPAQTLLDGVEVSVPPNSQVLRIDYTDRTARSAQAGARAFAQAYLGYRAGEATRARAASHAALDADLADAQGQLRQYTDKIAALPDNSPDRTYAEAQRGVLGTTISGLSARISALDAGTPSPGSVISDATLPTRASSPVPLLDLGAGLGIGLLLGLALVGLVDRLDTRLRSAGDVARRTGLPVLAELPRPGRRREAATAAVLDRLRNALSPPGLEPRPGLLLVSDVQERGAAGPVALGIVTSSARTGRDALLVVTTPASPLTAELRPGAPGLSELLQGSATLAEVRTRLAGSGGAQVVPVGRDPEALETLLQGPSLAGVLRDLQDGGALVVVETAGTGRSAGAQAVAARCDTGLLVAERGATRDRELHEAAESALQVGVPLAGVVLVPRGTVRRTTRPAAEDASAPAPVPPVPAPAAVRPSAAPGA